MTRRKRSSPEQALSQTVVPGLLLRCRALSGPHVNVAESVCLYSVCFAFGGP